MSTAEATQPNTTGAAVVPTPPAPPPAAPLALTETGIDLKTDADVWRYAVKLSKAEEFTSQFMATYTDEKSGRDYQAVSPDKVFAAVCLARELRVPILRGIQNIAVINGKASIFGDLLLAIAMRDVNYLKRKEEEIGERGKSSWGYRCTIWRRDTDEPIAYEFTMEDAATAGLTNKKGPWQQYPKRMLQMRARMTAIRDAFPEALSGFMPTEEARDMDAAGIGRDAAAALSTAASLNERFGAGAGRGTTIEVEPIRGSEPPTRSRSRANILSADEIIREACEGLERATTADDVRDILDTWMMQLPESRRHELNAQAQERLEEIEAADAKTVEEAPQQSPPDDIDQRQPNPSEGEITPAQDLEWTIRDCTKPVELTAAREAVGEAYRKERIDADQRRKLLTLIDAHPAAPAKHEARKKQGGASA